MEGRRLSITQIENVKTSRHDQPVGSSLGVATSVRTKHIGSNSKNYQSENPGGFEKGHTVDFAYKNQDLVSRYDGQKAPKSACNTRLRNTDDMYSRVPKMPNMI